MGEWAAAAGRACLALAVLCMASLLAGSGQAADKPKIIATLFPQYDFARRIAGDGADVSLLLPPGAESHSYEPTPTDMKKIAAAALFIYTGPHMEPWAKRLADAASRPEGVTVVDASRGIAPRPDADHADHGGHDHPERDDGPGGAHYHEFDPHIWLDPELALVMVDNIALAIEQADPANAERYRHNAAALKRDIAELDAAFRRRIEPLPRRTLVFGERFAFRYFFDRYGLDEVGAYKSCAPGAEPGLRAVVATVDYVKERGVRFIYLEATETGRISRVIHEETGAEILKVDSLHNPPAARQAVPGGYVAIMRENMDAFARGLE